MELGLHAYAYCSLPYPEFPLQPFPHPTEVSKNGGKLNIGDSTSCRRPKLSEASFSVRNKSYFYNINHLSGSHLKLCTTRKRCQGNPPGKPSFFFFPAARASLICANINTFPRQKGGREVGRREAGTNPQVLRTTVLSLQLFECEQRLKQMSQMDIEPEDTWGWCMIALHINSTRTAFGP